MFLKPYICLSVANILIAIAVLYAYGDVCEWKSEKGREMGKKTANRGVREEGGTLIDIPIVGWERIFTILCFSLDIVLIL